MTSATSLADKYTVTSGRIYVTGSQALTRLPMLQQERDAAAGINSSGYISGYRGSPLGIYDLALWQAKEHLDRHNIHFEPGTNEDLAATAVWGTQQVGLPGSEANYDGVFAMWYGKGPGVDRSGDPIKHGNYAGANAKGGVLLLCGDDHAARSSTVPHQSEHALIHFGMPVLNPADIQEYLDLGLMGFALSRYSGCWVGFKCVTDTVDGSASVLVDPDRVRIELPQDFTLPPGGLGIRVSMAPPLENEKRLYELRHAAAQAFARANKLDGVRFGPLDGPITLGIVTAGKSYLDTLEALAKMGIDEARASQLGIAVYKVAMVYPLEPQGIVAFAGRCTEMLVVEEKRSILEDQIARLIVNLGGDRPRLVGKVDEQGATLISSVGELQPDLILRVIANRFLALSGDKELAALWSGLTKTDQSRSSPSLSLARVPSFCAGCPHNTSTRVPEGSRAMAGIGCHGLASYLPERNTSGISQMGGEGGLWIGQHSFVKTPHIFQNLGDGTYFHSGLLAIRACVAAGVNVTYKILLNGAVGMTGGQPIEGEHFEGELTAPHVAAQLNAEGVKRIAVVSDDPLRHKSGKGFPPGVTFHHRDALDAVQREMRDITGVTAIIYEQSCATERRRLRKRGKVADPNERLFIHPDVCEGCGDCGEQSNCVALEPLETSLGRKRQINQSICNKDFSCVKGMCPSFVSVIGGTLRKRAVETSGLFAESLPEPAIAAPDEACSILVAGIGGNGVVTIGSILGMAAHMEGRPVTVLDMSGLAQRNGPVTSHIRLGGSAKACHTARIPLGGANLLLACDLVAASGAENLSKISSDRSTVVFNHFVAPTSAFAGNPDLDFSHSGLETAVLECARAGFGIDATGAAQRLLGDAIGANMLLVGYAWQKGLIPLRRQSIENAIRLNGAQTDLNLKAFALGRLAADDPERFAREFAPASNVSETTARPSESLAAIADERAELLTGYQGKALARRYRFFVERVKLAESSLGSGDDQLAIAVARTYAKLLAYKDEYEVGRLFSSQLQQHIGQQFDGEFKLQFHLAPPLLARRDKSTGRYRKMRFGPWIMILFRLLARLKVLRGTPLDIFGYSHHRRLERSLIAEYEQTVAGIVASLTIENHTEAVEIAGLAARIRGFDTVKEASVAAVRLEVSRRLTLLHKSETAEV